MKHVVFSTGIGHMEFINRRTRIGVEDYIEDLNGQKEEYIYMQEEYKKYMK